MGKCLIDISGFEMFYGSSVACDLAFVFVCDNKKKYTKSQMLGRQLLIKIITSPHNWVIFIIDSLHN